MAAIAAAFPTVRIGQATSSLYARKLRRYDFDVALRAVDELLDVAERWPSPATVRKAIESVLQRERDERLRLRALEEPELAPEQREENLRRVRELAEGIGRE
jgi:hypothetical protein